MTPEAPLRDVILKLLETGDLTFRDFVELALYHPRYGYYSREQNPVGKGADYVTSPALSPVFSFALARLIQEFVSRGGDSVSTVVDIGCGDGSLIHSLYESAGGVARAPRFFGVDRSLTRVPADSPVRFVRSLEEVPCDGQHLLIANELFDALPFARLVQRDEHVHELWVTERSGELDWTEHEAPAPYEDYFAARGIELVDGQFADISFDWEEQYAEICRFLRRGLIITFDYGFPERQLFDARIRRFGTAAAYRERRVTRDLLRDPGMQDLTAHINFTDLIRAGEREGLRTLHFDRQAKFLLSLGAAEHELLRPIQDLAVTSLQDGVDALQRRDDARRLLLPDGIGDDIRVLVQEKGGEGSEWSFQRPIFHR